MDFSLNDTQREIQSLATRIFTDHCTQDRLRTLDGNGYFDAELWRVLGEAGLLGVALDEAHGGAGLDVETLCLVLEEAGRHVAPLPLLPLVVSGALVLQRRAPQLLASLPGLASGEAAVTAAVNELGVADARQPATTGRPAGDGWVLNGAKTAVPAVEQGGHAWVTAQAGKGLGIFWLDLKAPGVTIERQRGTTGEWLGRLQLADAPATLLAEGDAALEWLATAEQLSRTAAAAQAVGLCDGMVRLGATYTSERVQFGQPIARFQAVAHQLADASIETEALRAATIQAVCLAGQDTVEAREAALVAKLLAAQALHRVSHTVQQVHGGTGVDRDYPLFRYALAAKQLELSWGGSEALLQELGAAL